MVQIKEKDFMIFYLLVFLILYYGYPQELSTSPYNLELRQVSDVRRRLANMTAPLFEGIGTHYSFIWVGTPPQRVSVIMDTGSHHTAFPCVGCNCGQRVSLFLCCCLCYMCRWILSLIQ
jgi:hypothetical protein